MKLIFTIYRIIIPALIFNTLYLHSMRSNRHSNARRLVTFSSQQTKLKEFKQEKYEQSALLAEQHNQNNPLLLLPKEPLIQILSSCQTYKYEHEKPLEKSMQFFIQLKTVCKNFNTLFTYDTIGNLCKNYTIDGKTDTLTNLIETTNSLNYKTKRLPALILICAGANINPDIHSNFLLQKAVAKNDTQMVATLFKHHACPNVTLPYLGPLFFHITTIEIVQLFINQGINAYIAEQNYKPQIFKQIMEDIYPSEIMTLYFKHNPDTAKLSCQDKSSLLHIFAKPHTMVIHNVDNFLKKAELILQTIPEMINTFNSHEQTPLDIAQESLNASKQYGTPETFEKLITLFKEYGAKTTEEIYPNCCICMCRQENMLDVPCFNVHDQCCLCLPCYSELLTTSDNCPICRRPLKI